MKKRCKFGLLFIAINAAVLWGVASFSHFAYEIFGKSPVVGLFSPVNESVWEHLKLLFFPLLLWWLIAYFIWGKPCAVGLRKWTVAAAVGLLTAMGSVLLLYYAYTGDLGVESAVVDIVLTYVGFFLGLLLAFHAIRYANPGLAAAGISVLVIALIALAFFLFTFRPPHLPLFYDTSAGIYGPSAE